MRKISVDEIKGEKNNNIALRIKGFDLSFVATPYSISIYVDKDIADKIIFQLQSLLQDMERNKK